MCARESPVRGGGPRESSRRARGALREGAGDRQKDSTAHRPCQPFLPQEPAAQKRPSSTAWPQGHRQELFTGGPGSQSSGGHGDCLANGNGKSGHVVIIAGVILALLEKDRKKCQKR